MARDEPRLIKRYRAPRTAATRSTAEWLLSKERAADELREQLRATQGQVQRLRLDLEAARARALRFASGELCSACGAERQHPATN